MHVFPMQTLYKLLKNVCTLIDTTVGGHFSFLSLTTGFLLSLPFTMNLASFTASRCSA